MVNIGQGMLFINLLTQLIEKHIFLCCGGHSKGQKISKAIYGILSSSKKQPKNVYRFWKNSEYQKLLSRFTDLYWDGRYYWFFGAMVCICRFSLWFFNFDMAKPIFCEVEYLNIFFRFLTIRLISCLKLPSLWMSYEVTLLTLI